MVSGVREGTHGMELKAGTDVPFRYIERENNQPLALKPFSDSNHAANLSNSEKE